MAVLKAVDDLFARIVAQENDRKLLLNLVSQAQEIQDLQPIVNYLKERVERNSYDKEDVNPKLRNFEKTLAEYIFNYYLRDYDKKEWSSKVFNREILKKDYAIQAAFGVLFPEELGVRSFQEKENLFFVRNHEYFNVLYALQSGNVQEIQSAQDKYERYVKANR